MAVKVGFIGTGGIANAHQKNLKTFDDVEFVAMCDVVEEKAKARANEYGGKAFTDYKEMFDKVDLDALYVCTPPFAHGEQERLACEKGVAMFIEKPIGVTWEQSVIINEMIERSGIITSVGYHWRYGGGAQTALKALEGEIILGSLGYWMGGMPGVSWWRVRAESGGQHVEQTTHIFDLCRYIVGSNAVLVHGVANSGGMTHVENYDVDDISMVNIVFENGVVANITSACAMKGFGRVHLEVFCPGLVITLGGGGSPQINREGKAEEVEGVPGLDRDRVFIDAVKAGDGSKILSPYSDALETHKITMAASKSFATGKAVDV